MFSETRRFIAGAHCPRCAAQDRVVVYRRDGLDHRECVACGWIEVWGGAPAAGARAPGGPRSGRGSGGDRD